MTICIATNVTIETIGGVAVFNQHFISLFTRHRHRVILLMIDPKSTLLEDEIISHNSLTLKVLLRKSYHQELIKVAPYFRPNGCNAPQQIAMGLAMRKWILENQALYDIDVIEASDHGGFSFFLSDKDLPPLLITTHASNLQITKYNYACDDEHGKVIKQLEELAYKSCDGIISHSAIINKELATLTKKSIFLLPIPWEKSSNYKTQEEGFGLVIGQLQVLKGPIFLLESLKSLIRKDKSLVILWIGDDTNTLKGRKSVAEFLKSKFPQLFGNNFYWIKALPHDKVLQEIARASFVIIPSLWETFNYVALEAASMAKPIIITKSTGASYLFENEINALVIEDENEEELCEAILKLHSDIGLRAFLGKKAQEMVYDNFEPSKIVSRRIEVYNKVISERVLDHVTLEEKMLVLRQYMTRSRKLYFFMRAKLKAILKSK